MLVGGLGSRMADGAADTTASRVFLKPLLDFGPDAARGPDVVLNYVLAAVRPQVQAVCLCAHDDAQPWARFGLPVVLDGDTADRHGPLAGMVAGLGWAERQGLATLLIVPGDTPFLPADLLARLGEAPAVAEAGGRVHHLVCHLPVGVRPRLAAALASGHSRVGHALEALGARRVRFDDEAAFLNINTPQDYRQARERFAGAANGQSEPR